jgi:hypothetical protein
MKSVIALRAITFLALAFFLVCSGISALFAAELVMIEQKHCPWCEAWNDEIGGIYDKTTEGKLAPLRRIDVHGPLPADLADMEMTVFTPTFVLRENGSEIARLRGYPGDEFFWYLLGEMLDKLPNSAK